MARWRLAAPHYLNVEGTQWEYKETDRTTGRPKRFLFPVPLHLDPDNPADWTHRGVDGGEIIVSNGSNADPKDIIFIGEPTPDMVPLDDEAKAITAKLASKWKHPIESLTGSYADAMLRDLEDEVSKVRAEGASAKVEGMAELLTAMTEMMKQNQQIIESLAKPARRTA